MTRRLRLDGPRVGFDLDHEHDGRRWVYKLATSYSEALAAAGAIPVPILPGDPRPPAEILGDVDGFLLTGGDDFHPALVGRAADGLPMTLLSVHRERFVLSLARAILTGNVPCLGICLGCQALNVAGGGDIWLDLPAELPNSLEHRGGAKHVVRAEPGGILARSWKDMSPELSSHHHQAVRRVSDGFTVEARADDGVVEAFSATDRPNLLAVQWHPELHARASDGAAPLRWLVMSAMEASANAAPANG